MNAGASASARQFAKQAATPGYQHYKDDGEFSGIPAGMHTNPLSKALQGSQASIQFLSSEQNRGSVKGLGKWNRQSTIDFGGGEQMTPMPTSYGA